MNDSQSISSYNKEKENLVSIEQNENIIQLNQDLYVRQSLYEYFKKVENQRILSSRNKHLIQHYNTHRSKDKKIQFINGDMNCNSIKSIAEIKQLPYLYSQQHLNKVRSMPKISPLTLRKYSSINAIGLKLNTKGYCKPLNTMISSLDFNNIVTHNTKLISETYQTKSSIDIFSKFNSIDEEFPKKLSDFMNQDQFKVKKNVEKQSHKMNNPIISYNFCEQLLKSITRKISFYNQKNELLKEDDVVNVINDEIDSFFDKNTDKFCNKTISYSAHHKKILSPNRTNVIFSKKVQKRNKVKEIQLSKSYEYINRRIHPMTTILDKMVQTSLRKKSLQKSRAGPKSRNLHILKDSYSCNKEDEELMIKQIMEKETQNSLHSLLARICKNNFNNKTNTNNNSNLASNINKKFPSRHRSSNEESNDSNFILLKSRPFNKNNGNKPNNDDLFGLDYDRPEELKSTTRKTTTKKTTKTRKSKKKTVMRLNKKSVSSVNVHFPNEITETNKSPNNIKRKKNLTQFSKLKGIKDEESKVSFYEGQMQKLLFLKEEQERQKELEEKTKSEEESKRKQEELINEVNAKYERERKKRQEADFKEFSEKMKEEEKKFTILRKQEEIQRENDWLSQTMFYNIFNQSNNFTSNNNTSNNSNKKKVLTAIQEATCGIPNHILFSQETLSPSSITEEILSKKPSINMLSPIKKDDHSASPSLESMKDHLDEEGEDGGINDNALNSEKKRKILLLRLKNSINYALSKNPLNEKGEGMFNEFKERLEALKQFNEDDYVKKLEENYKSVKDEIDNMEKLKEDERRINMFVDNLKFSLNRVIKTKGNERNRIKVVDYRFKTYASSLLIQPDL